MSNPQRPFSALDLCAAVGAALIWGLNFIPMKVALHEVTPIQLGTARFLFGALPLVFFVPLPRIGLGWLVLYSLVQGVAQSMLLFFAFKVGMTAALAPVLMQTQVFFTALLGVAFLGETIGRPLKVGIVLAGGGLACFAVNALAAGGTAEVTPLALTLNIAAAAMWSLSSIIVKRIQASGAKLDTLSLLVWSCAVSAAVFLLFSVTVEDAGPHGTWLQASPAAWASAAYLGWGANLTAYWLWTSLLHRHPANRIAPFGLGMPVVGLLAGMLVLGETVDAWQWTGAVLVISALFFVAGGPGLLRRPGPR